MTTTLRWVIVAVLVGQGLIHLLGAAKGFGFADVSPLTKPIGVLGGGPHHDNDRASPNRPT